jgi:hypothetical protein
MSIENQNGKLITMLRECYDRIIEQTEERKELKKQIGEYEHRLNVRNY